MKKVLLLVATSLALLLVPGRKGFAQGRFNFGVKGGLSVPNLTSGSSSPISSGYGSRLDADAAIQAGFNLTKRFSIEAQLEYSSQGGKKNGTQAFVVPAEMVQLFPEGQVPDYLYATYKSEARMNYLVLPVLAKYRFDLKKRFGAYIATGPFISYLLSARNITKGSSLIYLNKEETQSVTPQPQSFDSKDNIRDELHHFNTGVSGHVGIDYKLSKGSIFIEAGGNYGLINIQKNQVDGKNKTGAFVLNLGYQFRL
jgi:hypothetical protein